MEDLLGQKLRKIREAQRMSQGRLEELTGIDRNYISRIENDHVEPKASTLASICRGLGVSPSVLWGDESPGEEGNTPVVGHVSGGESEHLWGDADLPTGEGFVLLQGPHSSHDPNIFALEIRGDSMSPKFDEGDRVIVAPGKEARSGCLAVIRTKEGKSYFKRVFFRGNDVILESFNSAHGPIILRKRDLHFAYPVICIIPRPRDAS